MRIESPALGNPLTDFGVDFAHSMSFEEGGSRIDDLKVRYSTRWMLQSLIGSLFRSSSSVDVLSLLLSSIKMVSRSDS